MVEDRPGSTVAHRSRVREAAALSRAAKSAHADLDTWTKRAGACAPRLRAAVSILRRTLLAMPTRTRTPNVAAAQCSPNGGALGQADLTQPNANVFGENVFSIAVQRQRLPKAQFC